MKSHPVSTKPRLTYAAKHRAQLEALFHADLRVCSPGELRIVDRIHRRLLSGKELFPDQAALLSKLMRKLESSE